MTRSFPDTAHTGPVTQPPEEHKTMSSDMADLLGTSPRVGDTVYYQYQPGTQWAAIVVSVKENDILDLVVFRPDGNTTRGWNVPKASGVRWGDCWRERT